MSNTISPYNRTFYRSALQIGFPIIVQHLISISLNMIDTLMIGKLGELQLAAVGAANRVSFIFIIMCFGFFSGCTVHISQYWGVKDIGNIRRLTGMEYLFGTALAVVFMAASLLWPRELLDIFVDSPVVIGYGAAYLRIIQWTFLIECFGFAIAINSRSIRRLVVPTVINACAMALNTFLNYCLIYGHFGFPELGVEGAAWATVIARLLETIALFVYVYASKEHPLAARWHELFDWTRLSLRVWIKTSLPVLISETAWSVGNAVYYIAFGKISDVAIAVVQVTVVVFDLFTALFFGIGTASAVMIGNELGRGQRELAYDYAKIFLKLSLYISVIASFCFFISRYMIVDIYDFSAETNATIFSTFTVYAIFLTPKMMTYMLFIGVLRAGGDTKFTMYVDLSCIWLIGVPLSFFGALVLHWSLPAVAALAFAEEIIKTFICLRRVKSKKWINVLV